MPDALRLLLVDGSASLYRAFFALPALTNSRGTPTNAVLGFATILLKLLREEKPAAAAVVSTGLSGPPVPVGTSAKVKLRPRLSPPPLARKSSLSPMGRR